MIGKGLEYLKENKIEIAYRGWNGLTALAVSQQLLTNPSASVAEYLPDILLHGVEAIIPDTLPTSCMLLANSYRFVQAGVALATNKAFFFTTELSSIPLGLHGTLPKVFSFVPTTIPNFANFLDLVNHSCNLLRHSMRLPDNEQKQKLLLFTPRRSPRLQALAEKQAEEIEKNVAAGKALAV